MINHSMVYIFMEKKLIPWKIRFKMYFNFKLISGKIFSKTNQKSSIELSTEASIENCK